MGKFACHGNDVCGLQLILSSCSDILFLYSSGKTLVALNVMWTHVEQQSFPMSEEEYDDKLETIATYIRYACAYESKFQYLRLFFCCHLV